jgi:hypothetical protein
VLQRAVAMALEPVYEQDFLDCSYGFRPKRSQHQALESLRKGLMELEGGYLIDLDIRRYFDTVDHRRIQQILRQRVRDGVIRRLIGKWLNAGVMEQRRVSYPEEGVPQGGVISPLLSNIYLHEVLDTWFEHQVKPRLKGKAQMIRFADDAILAFERRDDAERVHRVLAERFESYGLTLHPDKTKLVPFRRPPLPWEQDGGRPQPETFDFLGFTPGADARPCIWPAGGRVATEAGRKAELVLRAKPSWGDDCGLALRTPRRMPSRLSPRPSVVVAVSTARWTVAQLVEKTSATACHDSRLAQRRAPESASLPRSRGGPRLKLARRIREGSFSEWSATQC